MTRKKLSQATDQANSDTPSNTSQGESSFHPTQASASVRLDTTTASGSTAPSNTWNTFTFRPSELGLHDRHPPLQSAKSQPTSKPDVAQDMITARAMNIRRTKMDEDNSMIDEGDSMIDEEDSMYDFEEWPDSLEDSADEIDTAASWLHYNAPVGSNRFVAMILFDILSFLTDSEERMLLGVEYSISRSRNRNMPADYGPQGTSSKHKGPLYPKSTTAADSYPLIQRVVDDAKAGMSERKGITPPRIPHSSRVRGPNDPQGNATEVSIGGPITAESVIKLVYGITASPYRWPDNRENAFDELRTFLFGPKGGDLSADGELQSTHSDFDRALHPPGYTVDFLTQLATTVVEKFGSSDKGLLDLLDLLLPKSTPIDANANARRTTAAELRAQLHAAQARLRAYMYAKPTETSDFAFYLPGGYRQPPSRPDPTVLRSLRDYHGYGDSHDPRSPTADNTVAGSTVADARASPLDVLQAVLPATLNIVLDDLVEEEGETSSLDCEPSRSPFPTSNPSASTDAHDLSDPQRSRRHGHHPNCYDALGILSGNQTVASGSSGSGSVENRRPPPPPGIDFTLRFNTTRNAPPELSSTPDTGNDDKYGWLPPASASRWHVEPGSEKEAKLRACGIHNAEEHRAYMVNAMAVERLLQQLRGATARAHFHVKHGELLRRRLNELIAELEADGAEEVLANLGWGYWPRN
ncbi:MAG: hypothetical protein M1821_006161 [Bathelium mastoideum]|nr:MAG: hypothetical protein M1821_006161 [Bathelium mastoideum]